LRSCLSLSERERRSLGENCASLSLYLSASRCIVLAESSTGHWRLWQILRLLPSLRDWMLEPELDASELLTRVAESAR
jgi:hypothetical protein